MALVGTVTISPFKPTRLFSRPFPVLRYPTPKSKLVTSALSSPMAFRIGYGNAYDRLCYRLAVALAIRNDLLSPMAVAKLSFDVGLQDNRPWESIAMGMMAPIVGPMASDTAMLAPFGRPLATATAATGPF